MTGPRTRRVVAGVVCALAAALVAFCGWATLEYSRGSDPLSSLAGSGLLTTVATDDPASSGAAASTSADVAGGEVTSATSEGTAGSASSASSPASSDDGGSSQEAVASAGTGAAAEEAASPASSSTSDGSSSEATAITVVVTVDGSAAGGTTRSERVSLATGATAYDALVASGADVNARSTAYGTYVAAIDGLAERDHGSRSGWTYAVDGTMPDVACSSYELEDGDSLVWTYVNVEQ